MKISHKFAVLLVVMTVTTLFAAAPAFANFTSISGQINDSRTNTGWTYGATITVYSCADMTTPLTSGSANGTGEFSLSGLGDPGSFRMLCVDFVFSDGGNGIPASKLLAVRDKADDSGNKNMGIIYTDTGPNAVQVRSLTASSVRNTWLPAALAVSALILVSSAITVIGRRKA